MQIVNVIKESFQEYKDQISLVLFSFGCNFHCNGCYNYEYVNNIKNVIGNVKDIINKNKNPLHDAIVFLGGEPTIWKTDLLYAADYAKNLGLKTKIFTNGFLPDVIDMLNQYKVIDAYSVDFKAITNVSNIIKVKMNDEEYLYRVNCSLNSIIKCNIQFELRTTKFKDVNIEEVQEYVQKKYPFAEHIIQEDFVKNYAEIT